MADESLSGSSVNRAARAAGDTSLGLMDLVNPLIANWKLWVFGSLGVGLIALGIAFQLTPQFTARTSFLPPQQQQSGVASALASLGGLAGLAGVATGLRSPADQYVALMQSVTITDKLVDQFKLMEVYEAKYRFAARQALEQRTRIAVGKKDGLISVEVDDTDPQRAADLANAYVEELRRLTSVLAVSEAQQRRLFFERELKEARDQLAKAQQVLQASGYSPGALRAEPRASAEGYARLKAEITAAEVKVQVLRRSLADSAPEVQRQLSEISALRSQLARLEQSAEASVDANYLTKYREFKYRETLFELFAKQYEIARVDESREGVLIQVVDAATPPEYRSKPKRGFIAVSATAAAALLIGMLLVLRSAWRGVRAVQPDPSNPHRLGPT